MELLYGSAERVIAPLLRAWFRWDMDGVDRLPSGGPAIIAANHVSVLDPFVVAYALHAAGLRGRFLAKAELFRQPVLRRILVALGQVPVHRGSGDSKALDLAEQALWRGRVVVVFPEGTIGPGRPMLPAKSGTARLSIATGVPVTPMAIWGGQAVFPRGGKPRLRRGAQLRVLVGEPLEPPTAVPGSPRSKAFTDQIALRLDELVEKIAFDA